MINEELKVSYITDIDKLSKVAESMVDNLLGEYVNHIYNSSY